MAAAATAAFLAHMLGRVETMPTAPTPSAPLVRPTGRRVVSAQEITADLPQTRLELRAYTPITTIAEELARLTAETGLAFDLHAINARTADAARFPINIRNYQRAIDNWKAQIVELKSAEPFDDYARNLHAQAKDSTVIDRRQAAAAVRVANTARERVEKKARAARRIVVDDEAEEDMEQDMAEEMVYEDMELEGAARGRPRPRGAASGVQDVD